MSTAERAGKAGSTKHVNEWTVRANERADKRMAQYYMPKLHSHSTQGDVLPRQPTSTRLEDMSQNPKTLSSPPEIIVRDAFE